MRQFYCYELSDAGLWEPCVYRTNFGDPTLDERARTQLVEVPEDCMDEFSEPLFGRLRDRFPMEVEND